MPSDAEIIKTIDSYIHGSEHPDLQVYRRGVMDDHFISVWLWRMKQYCRLGNFYKQRILEVGCGFGWDAVGLALIGDNEVIASDVLPSMIDGVRECTASMAAAGTPIAITPMQGDICQLDLPPASVGGIFSSEAIEHVHDLQAMFENCHRLLETGGRMVIANDSNRYNEEARNHSQGSWQERDESWDHAEWLKTEVRPVEHRDTRPYAVMREDMIRQHAPDLDEESVAKLRAATAGMIRSDIPGAVDSWRKSRILPQRPELSWCRNPETGEYSERLLDPFELKAMLRQIGFDVQLRHLFRKLPLRLLNGVQWPLVNKRLFALRPQFVLVARKL